MTCGHSHLFLLPQPFMTPCLPVAAWAALSCHLLLFSHQCQGTCGRTGSLLPPRWLRLPAVAAFTAEALLHATASWGTFLLLSHATSPRRRTWRPPRLLHASGWPRPTHGCHLTPSSVTSITSQGGRTHYSQEKLVLWWELLKGRGGGGGEQT